MSRRIIRTYKLRFGIPDALNLGGLILLFISTRWSDVCFGLWALVMARESLRDHRYERTIGLIGIALSASLSWLPVHDSKITICGYVLLGCSVYLAFHEDFREQGKRVATWAWMRRRS